MALRIISLRDEINFPMQNAAVAQMFDEIAAYLEITGENPFKIRAYRRAAEAIATYNAPIEDAAEAGILEEIEGLGPATAEKTREFLATGKVRYLERLKEQYPASLLELLRVPNLGPKRIAQLYQERHISSIEELKAALESGALEGLAGFGPKTLQNIRSGLARMAQMTTRLPLDDGLALAGRLVIELLKSEEAVAVEVAGSLRRGCDTIGNINLVAEVAQEEDAPPLIEEFIALPSVLTVEEQTLDKAHVRVHSGLEVHLYCALTENFGAALFHATGSALHVLTAEQRAAARGLRLDRTGLYRGDERLAGECEADIYEALGVPFIAPELREDRGEWEAADEGKLPQLIKVDDLRGDLHAHSTWSDGAVSIRQMVLAARERGYSYLAITDHSKALAMANGLNADRLREQANEIAEVQAEFPDFKILRGVECDILRDGTLDLDDDILHELDIVVASVHSGFNLDEATQTARMIRALSHPAVDIVAHPTGRVLGVRPGYEVDVSALIAAARDTGTALEINASERLDLRDTHAREARDAGVLLAIDSDAHSQRMLPNVAYGVLTARRAWCRPSDILNTKTTEELLQWLNRPQSRPWMPPRAR
ncbi:MAG: DNA polymerase/3'-5' exonuclease PolX [Armatimonadota bacterium]|nr:DNA polymerase/3'-5' exonuclease PolX [Armatimonadota bacterium]